VKRTCDRFLDGDLGECDRGLLSRLAVSDLRNSLLTVGRPISAHADRTRGSGHEVTTYLLKLDLAGRTVLPKEMAVPLDPSSESPRLVRVD
jgi:hypothetical protein